MDSTLRPRDIQSRIRAGETPEAVAEAAQTTVDRIMAFAAPVLAERAHVADRAQRSSVRRRAGAGAVGVLPARGEAVPVSCGRNIDPDSVEWDAWRREDGRWTLIGTTLATRAPGHAAFIYDGPGNYVIAEDDEARWLVGESAAVAQGAEPRDRRRARARRLTSRRGRAAPGDDAIELPLRRATRSGWSSRRPAGPVRGPPVAAAMARTGSMPTSREAFLDVEPGRGSAATRRRRRAAALDDEGAVVPSRPGLPGGAPEPEPDEPPAPRRPVRKSRGRASVPSWDEIMFGGGKPTSERGSRAGVGPSRDPARGPCHRPTCR